MVRRRKWKNSAEKPVPKPADEKDRPEVVAYYVAGDVADREVRVVRWRGGLVEVLWDLEGNGRFRARGLTAAIREEALRRAIGELHDARTAPRTVRKVRDR